MPDRRNSRDRKDDKGLRKRIPLLHYLAAFALGWHLKGLFPDTTKLVDLLGDGWDWFLGSVNGLGGLLIIGSFSKIVWDIYKEYQARKEAKQ